MGECVICGIIRKEDEQHSRVIYSDPMWEALLVLHPATYGHFIVYPREHYASLSDMGERAGNLTTKAIQLAEGMMKRLRAPGYYLKVNNNVYSIEKNYSKHVGHIHMHVVPRYSGNDAFSNLGIQDLKPYFDACLTLMRV